MMRGLMIFTAVLVVSAPSFAYDESRSGFGGDNFTNFGSAAFGEGLGIEQVARTESQINSSDVSSGVEAIEPAAGADSEKSADAATSDDAPSTDAPVKVDQYIFP